MTPETSFRKDINTLLDGSGAVVFKVVGDMRQGIGWPDIYIAHPIWTGWLELKCNNNTCSAQQALCLRDLRRNKVPAFVLRRIDKTRAVLEFEGNKVIGKAVGAVELTDCYLFLRRLKLFSSINL